MMRGRVCGFITSGMGIQIVVWVCCCMRGGSSVIPFVAVGWGDLVASWNVGSGSVGAI